MLHCASCLHTPQNRSDFTVEIDGKYGCIFHRCFDPDCLKTLPDYLKSFFDGNTKTFTKVILAIKGKKYVINNDLRELNGIANKVLEIVKNAESS
jgi:hypothetical protein